MQLILDGTFYCLTQDFTILPFAGQLIVDCADLIFKGSFE